MFPPGEHDRPGTGIRGVAHHQLNHVAPHRHPGRPDAFGNELFRQPGAELDDNHPPPSQVVLHQRPGRGEVGDVPGPAPRGTAGRVEEDPTPLGNLDVLGAPHGHLSTPDQSQVGPGKGSGHRIQFDGMNAEARLREGHRVNPDPTSQVPDLADTGIDEPGGTPPGHHPASRLFQPIGGEKHLFRHRQFPPGPSPQGHLGQGCGGQLRRETPPQPLGGAERIRIDLRSRHLQGHGTVIAQNVHTRSLGALVERTESKPPGSWKTWRQELIRNSPRIPA